MKFGQLNMITSISITKRYPLIRSGFKSAKHAYSYMTKSEHRQSHSCCNLNGNVLYMAIKSLIYVSLQLIES